MTITNTPNPPRLSAVPDTTALYPGSTAEETIDAVLAWASWPTCGEWTTTADLQRWAEETRPTGPHWPRNAKSFGRRINVQRDVLGIYLGQRGKRLESRGYNGLTQWRIVPADGPRAPEQMTRAGLVAEVGRLRGLLDEFGVHNLGCNGPHGLQCKCGWAEVAAALGINEGAGGK